MNYEVSFGFYPGILVGFRTYEGLEANVHAIYLPFMSINIMLGKDVGE